MSMQLHRMLMYLARSRRTQISPQINSLSSEPPSDGSLVLPTQGIRASGSRRQFLRIGLAIAGGILLKPSAGHCAAILGEGGETGSHGEKICGEAEHIVHTLKHTHYQHHEEINPSTGTYDCDCSGFVSYVLKRVAPEQLQVIPKESSWAIPRAFKYEEFFSSLPGHAEKGWRKIRVISEVRRGDVMAWALPQNLGKDEDTGHVFVVAETPAKVEEGVFAVRVCDSSTVRHYDDSRAKSGEPFHTGVGTGTIHVKVDGAGKPQRFQFGKGDAFHTAPIAMGRAV
jgi:hypothetical protein